MKFLAALKFLTILPLGRQRQDSLEEIRGSLVYYPLVGLLIGLFLAGLNWLFSLVLPAALANALLLVSLVIVTGALHLDGFIDTCDGIAGHKPAEARWQVMRDSRTGAFGVVGAVLLLLLKYAALNSVPAGLLTPTLIMMPVLGRWAMVFAIFAYPYARPEGLGKVIKPGATWLTFAAATIITLAIGVGIAWLGLYVTAAVTMLGVWVIIVLAAAFFKKMFAGLTGDTYGAINEIAEVGALILITLLAHNSWLV